MSDAETIALAVAAGVPLGCALFIAYAVGVLQGRHEKGEEMRERGSGASQHEVEK